MARRQHIWRETLLAYRVRYYCTFKLTSSITNEVWFDAFSTPVNLTTTVRLTMPRTPYGTKMFCHCDALNSFS